MFILLSPVHVHVKQMWHLLCMGYFIYFFANDVRHDGIAYLRHLFREKIMVLTFFSLSPMQAIFVPKDRSFRVI